MKLLFPHIQVGDATGEFPMMNLEEARLLHRGHHIVFFRKGHDRVVEVTIDFLVAGHKPSCPGNEAREVPLV